MTRAHAHTLPSLLEIWSFLTSHHFLTRSILFSFSLSPTNELQHQKASALTLTATMKYFHILWRVLSNTKTVSETLKSLNVVEFSSQVQVLASLIPYVTTTADYYINGVVIVEWFFNKQSIAWMNVWECVLCFFFDFQEYNASDKEIVHFLQVWIEPYEFDLEPSYCTKKWTDDQKRNQLRLILSPTVRVMKPHIEEFVILVCFPFIDRSSPLFLIHRSPTHKFLSYRNFRKSNLLDW